MLTVIDNNDFSHAFEAEWCDVNSGALIVVSGEKQIAAFNSGQWKKWYVNAETVREEK